MQPARDAPDEAREILGVGEDPSGTLFVADVGGVAASPSTVRVFVPSHGSLVRQVVVGSGINGGANPEDIETFQSPGFGPAS